MLLFNLKQNNYQGMKYCIKEMIQISKIEAIHKNEAFLSLFDICINLFQQKEFNH